MGEGWGKGGGGGNLRIPNQGFIVSESVFLVSESVFLVSESGCLANQGFGFRIRVYFSFPISGFSFGIRALTS